MLGWSAGHQSVRLVVRRLGGHGPPGPRGSLRRRRRAAGEGASRFAVPMRNTHRRPSAAGRQPFRRPAPDLSHAARRPAARRNSSMLLSRRTDMTAPDRSADIVTAAKAFLQTMGVSPKDLAAIRVADSTYRRTDSLGNHQPLDRGPGTIGPSPQLAGRPWRTIELHRRDQIPLPVRRRRPPDRPRRQSGTRPEKATETEKHPTPAHHGATR